MLLAIDHQHLYGVQHSYTSRSVPHACYIYSSEDSLSLLPLYPLSFLILPNDVQSTIGSYIGLSFCDCTVKNYLRCVISALC